jgi:hypothetical protein
MVDWDLHQVVVFLQDLSTGTLIKRETGLQLLKFILFGAMEGNKQ